MRRISIGTFDRDPSDDKAVMAVLKSGMLSVGPEMDRFEYEIAHHHNKGYGVMVNSGQSALEVALMSAKERLGKDPLTVICPALTYAATLWAILRAGCTPVFCDVDRTFNLNWELAAELQADVVLSVDLCGKTAHPGTTSRFIIEDACEAVGNVRAGYGDLVCFSFYVSHIITTGSGGMVCLNDLGHVEWLRSFISHGRVYGGDFTKFTDGWVDRFKFDKVGASLRADNLHAALGLSQFRRLTNIVAKRKQNAKVLIDLYNADPLLREKFVFPDHAYWEDCVFQFFPILIRDASLDREHLLRYMFARGVDSRVLLSLTNQPVFMKKYGDIAARFPVANYCNDHGFILGCHQNLETADMEHIIDCLRGYLK